MLVRGLGQLPHGGQLHGRGFGHDLGALLLERDVPLHLFVSFFASFHQRRHLGLLFCLRFGQPFCGPGSPFVRSLQRFGGFLRLLFFHLPIVEHFGQEFILHPEGFRPVPDRGELAGLSRQLPIRPADRFHCFVGRVPGPLESSEPFLFRLRGRDLLLQKSFGSFRLTVERYLPLPGRFFDVVVAAGQLRDLDIQIPDRVRESSERRLSRRGPFRGPLLGLLRFFHVVGEDKVGRAQGGDCDTDSAHGWDRKHSRLRHRLNTAGRVPEASRHGLEPGVDRAQCSPETRQDRIHVPGLLGHVVQTGRQTTGAAPRFLEGPGRFLGRLLGRPCRIGRGFAHAFFELLGRLRGLLVRESGDLRELLLILRDVRDDVQGDVSACCHRLAPFTYCSIFWAMASAAFRIFMSDGWNIRTRYGCFPPSPFWRDLM